MKELRIVPDDPENSLDFISGSSSFRRSGNYLKGHTLYFLELHCTCSCDYMITEQGTRKWKWVYGKILKEDFPPKVFINSPVAYCCVLLSLSVEEEETKRRRKKLYLIFLPFLQVSLQGSLLLSCPARTPFPTILSVRLRLANFSIRSDP